MNITLDGYLSGPGGELDWHFESWTCDMEERLMLELSEADIILLGRITYQQMASYWLGKTMDLLCARDEIALAAMMNRHQKIVYSGTLKEAIWHPSRIINGNINKAIHQLKQTSSNPGKNIIVYGSSRLAAALIKANLVDEYHLWVHPVILGSGRLLFSSSNKTMSLKSLAAKTFQSGVVLLQYQVV